MSQFKYLTTASGNYIINILFNGVSISGYPTNMRVLPNQPFFNNTNAAGDAISVATAGVSASFRVVTRDVFGNYITSGGLRMFVYLQGFLETVFSNEQQNLFDMNNGEYLVRYTCRLKGIYYIRALEGCEICPSDVSCKCGRLIHPLFNSQVRCLSSIISSGFTTINGLTNLGSMTAGTPKEYSIVARDSYGNVIDVNHFVVILSVQLVKSSSTASIHSTNVVMHEFKNLERVQILITLSGSYSISLIANLTGTHLSGSPISCLVLPGILSVLDSKFRTAPRGGPLNQPSEFCYNSPPDE
jgi:hypothetical protein